MGGGGDGSHSVAFFTPSLPERLLSPQLRSDDSAGGDSGAEGRRAGRAGRAQSGGEEREEEGGKRGKGGRQKSGREGWYGSKHNDQNATGLMFEEENCYIPHNVRFSLMAFLKF